MIGETIEVEGRRYVAVARSEDVQEGRGLLIELGNFVELAAIRSGGIAYVLTNYCPHQHSPLIASGSVSKGCVSCPLHDWTFDLKTGREINGMGTIKCYDAIELSGVLYADQSCVAEPKWMQY